MDNIEIFSYLKINYDHLLENEADILISEISEENMTKFLPENHDKVIILQRDPDDDEYVSMLAVVTEDNEIAKLFVDNARVTEEKLDMIIEEIANVNFEDLEIPEEEEG